MFCINSFRLSVPYLEIFYDTIEVDDFVNNENILLNKFFDVAFIIQLLMTLKQDQIAVKRQLAFITLHLIKVNSNTLQC